MILFSGDQIKNNKTGGHVKTTGEGRGTFRVFVGKCEGKKPNRRPRRRWVKQSCIKIYLKGMGWAGLDWIHEDRKRTPFNEVRY